MLCSDLDFLSTNWWDHHNCTLKSNEIELCECTNERKGHTHKKPTEKNYIMWRIFLLLCVFFSWNIGVGEWSLERGRKGEGGRTNAKERRKKLRPMKNRFDSRKHSTQTLDRLYSCSYKQFVLATLHSSYSSYEKPFAQPSNIFRISSAAHTHTNVQRVYSSSKKRKQLIQEREREQIKLLNPLQKFMDEMTTSLLFFEWK